MPVYNDADLLSKSIKSVINQSLDDIELICINDGSTDNTLEILHDFEKKYNFIKIFTQNNQGSGKARNKGINEANGEYIAFLDADDFFIDNNSLKKLYDIASLNNANMVSGNIKLVDADGNYSQFNDLDYYESDGKILPEDYGIPWAFYKSIYKTEFLINNKIYFPDLIRGQDPVFLAEVLSKIDVIYTASIDVYAYYYINGANQCNTFKKRFDHINHFKYIFQYFSDSKFITVRNNFKKKLFIFIDMMGAEGAEDTLFSIREIFKDDIILLNECEEYYYKKFFNNYEMLNKLNLANAPKISVIIPVYNAENFLNDSINSVLNQTFKNIELICVNDGSTDNSLQILNNFSKIDHRIKVIDKENGGCGSARNKSLDNANGDYIYFFDPDDYILPNAFEELYYNALKNKSDLVIFKIARFRDGEPIDYSVPGFNFDEVFPNENFDNFTFNYKNIKHYVLNSSFAPWSKLYKKSFLDKYDDFRFDLNVAFDDVPFHVKSLLRASKISFVPEFFYHYRLSNPNSVNNTKSNQIDIFRICDIVETFLREFDYFDEFKNEFIVFKLGQILNYIISSNFEDYYILAKQEFSKMNLLGFNIPKHLLDDYQLVLTSNSYNEFRVKKGFPPLNDNGNENIPKVSVIVPVYNTEEYVSECLESLINQTLTDIEIICVNDGSTDNSLEVLQDYAQKDSRVIVFSKENGGAGSARNLGLKNAKGEFINFIDSDDWLDLKTFEELYNKSKNEDLDMLMFQLINYDNNTGELYETDYYNISCIDYKFNDKIFNYTDISDNIFKIAVSPCNKLIKRDLINNLDFRFFEGVMFEDNPFFFELFLEANRVSIIRKHYYYRRRREGSVMSINGEKLNDIFQMTDEVVNIFIKKQLHEQFKKNLTNFKFYSIKTWYNEINDEFKETYFINMKNNFERIRRNEFLHNLFVTGLYSDTKRWFDLALIASNHIEFDFLLNNEIKDIIVQFNKIDAYENLINELRHDLTVKSENYNQLNSELSNKKDEINFLLTDKDKSFVEFNVLYEKYEKLIEVNKKLFYENIRINDDMIFLKKNNAYLKKKLVESSKINSKNFRNKINKFFK